MTPSRLKTETMQAPSVSHVEFACLQSEQRHVRAAGPKAKASLKPPGEKVLQDEKTSGFFFLFQRELAGFRLRKNWNRMFILSGLALQEPK